MADPCPTCKRPPGFDDTDCALFTNRRNGGDLDASDDEIDCERAGRLRALATIEAMTAEVAHWAHKGVIPFIERAPDEDSAAGWLTLARAWAKSKEPKP